MPTKVIVDTDPGVDDALALTLALRSPELDVKAVTVVAGNSSLEQCVRNAAGIVSLLNAQVPIAAGCSRPLKREPIQAQVHGNDGLGGASGLLPRGNQVSGVPADEIILGLADQYAGEIVLVALGPLTNIATAALKSPERFSRLARIVVMGGAFRVPGNMTAVAEFNIFADAEAARIVFSAPIPKLVVGLDVTTQVHLTRDAVLQSKCPGPLGGVLREATSYWMQCSGTGASGHGCLHDPLAVGAVIDASLLSYRETNVDVETQGRLTYGMTVADFRPDILGGNASVALAVDAARFLDLFTARVLNSP